MLIFRGRNSPHWFGCSKFQILPSTSNSFKSTFLGKSFPQVLDTNSTSGHITQNKKIPQIQSPTSNPGPPVSLIFQFPPSVSSKSPKVKGFHPSSEVIVKKQLCKAGRLESFCQEVETFAFQTGGSGGPC